MSRLKYYIFAVIGILAQFSCGKDIPGLLRGPRFTSEPPSRLVLSSANGAQVTCAARGNPQPHIAWLGNDGMPLMHISSLRHIADNGTLIFPPFPPSRFRHDIHATSYRCKASNKVGTIVSKEMLMSTVINEPWEPSVRVAQTQIGGTAIVSCSVAGPSGDHITVAAWYKNNNIISTTSSDSGGRFVAVPGTGALLVRDISSNDVTATFSCEAVDSLSGARKRSQPAYLIISDASRPMPPHIITSARDLIVNYGADVHIVCSAIAHPLATYSWYHIYNEGSLTTVTTNLRISINQEILYIRMVEPTDEGKWVCKAKNAHGEETQETRLTVLSKISVEVKPQDQVADSGSTISLKCGVFGSPVSSVRWLHNGALFDVKSSNDRLTSLDSESNDLNNNELIIRKVTRSHRGMYQCFASNGREETQDSAEVELGDFPPELQYTFIEQALHQGPPVSLKCTASGTPPPTFVWLLDGQIVSDFNPGHGIMIDQMVADNGNIISHLNISSARTEDGGRYTCRASNSIGSVEHTTRLNIYGPPSIRLIGQLKIVSGLNAHLYCPFFGFPISTVKWLKRGQQVTSNSRLGVSFDDYGTMQLTKVELSDAGTYTCEVSSPDGKIVARDIQVIVKNPPKLAPFSFPPDLEEGSSAQLLCGVVSGDRPIYFSWLKDGLPISPTIHVQEKSLEEFSFLIFTNISSKHSGDYTCVANNVAAKVNHTAELVVKVPPKWIHEPQNVSVLLGYSVVIHCDAHGSPVPKLTWFHNVGQISDDISLTSDYTRRVIKPNGTLIISNVSHNHEGQYVCQADNGVGSGLRKVIYLIVNKPVHFETISRNLSVKINNPIDLVCEVYGDNPIQIQWTHNMQRLMIDSYRMSMSEANIEFGLRSQIAISRTERKDSGTYHCLAENAFGRTEYTINLIIQERPERPVDLRTINISSRSAVLSWRQEFDGYSKVRGYNVQYGVLDSDKRDEWQSVNEFNKSMESIRLEKTNEYMHSGVTYSTTIDNLRPATTYAVRIAAYNDIDKSTFSDTVYIEMHGEAPSEPPHNIQVRTGGPGELVVSWEALPKDSWNGNILGYLITSTQLDVGESHSLDSRVDAVYGSSILETTINCLKYFTKYEVRVRAFNTFELGPQSLPAVTPVPGGALDQPPLNVKCLPMASQSIRVTWDQPSLIKHKLQILGYKIHYQVVKEDTMFWPPSLEKKRISSTDAYLYALQKATNYSIKVLAFTAEGDGLSSEAVFCSTEEDVPGSPASVKAISLTTNSILVSWLPPERKNGIILHYIVYKRIAGSTGTHTQHIAHSKEEHFDAKMRTSIKTLSMEFYGLEQQQPYEFWVTGVTSIGEGQPSIIIVLGTKMKSPARISSFGQHIKAAEHQGVVLHCDVPEQMSARTRWSTPLPNDPRISMDHENRIHIRDLDMSLSGNYTCSSRNAFGGESITHVVSVVRRPSPPSLRPLTLTKDRITLAWSQVYDGGAPVLGYTLYYRQEDREWIAIELLPELQSYTIHALICGRAYNLYAVATNGAGRSDSSEVIALRTDGRRPISPQLKDFVTSNITSVKLNLLLWDNGGCSINYFTIEHRRFDTSEWTSQKAELKAIKYRIDDLTPASWYYLKVTANNDAGSSEGRYYFSTLTNNGEKMILPSNFLPEWETNEIYTTSILSNWLALILCILLVIIFTAFVVLIALNWRHKRCTIFRGCFRNLCNSNDNKSVENQDIRISCQQVYTTSPVKRRDSKDNDELYEIHPYATFSMPVEGDVTNDGANGQANILMLSDDYAGYTFNRGNDDTKTRQRDGRSNISNKFKNYNSEDDYALSMAMTMVASSRSVKKKQRSKPYARSQGNAVTSAKFPTADESDSDSNNSPCADCKSNSASRTPVNNYNDTLQRIKLLKSDEQSDTSRNRGEEDGLMVEPSAKQEKIRQPYTSRHNKDCPVHIITKERAMTSSHADPQWRNHIW